MAIFISGCARMQPNSQAVNTADASKAVFLDPSGTDSRFAMTETDFPWSTTGRLFHNNGDGTIQLCTATMVGRRIAITAAHCVIKNGAIVPVTLQLSFNNSKFTQQANSLYIKVGTLNPEAFYSADWAVIELDANIGDFAGYLGVEFLGNLNAAVTVDYVGYSNNFQNSQVAGAERNCHIRELFPNGTFGHDCSMSPGGSGGPLFAADTSGMVHILAINTRGYITTYKDYQSNVANISVMNQDVVASVLDFRSRFDK